MSRIRVVYLRLRGSSCDNCAFAEIFRSNGDGQVTRLHTYCRASHSAHFNRPAPAERLCDRWQRQSGAVHPPSVGDPNLTA
jgi:hypothetical protein